MGLRSVFGKMGSTTMNNMAASGNKCIHKNKRLVLMLAGNCEAVKKNHNRGNNTKPPVTRTSANAHLFEYGCFDQNGFRIPNTVNRGIDYHMDLGGLGPACFALKEFNKRKKSQLQLVRLQRTWMKPMFHCSCLYDLLFEAVDAAGVVNLYLALVRLDDDGGLFLEYLSIYRDAGYFSSLYHHLDNFFVE